MDVETFGSNLIRIRKSKMVTQSQLADSVGVSVKTIRRYEHDETLPDAEMIKRISEALNVSSDLLLRDEQFYKMTNSKQLRLMMRYVFSRATMEDIEQAMGPGKGE